MGTPKRSGSYLDNAKRFLLELIQTFGVGQGHVGAFQLEPGINCFEVIFTCTTVDVLLFTIGYRDVARIFLEGDGLHLLFSRAETE